MSNILTYISQFFDKGKHMDNNDDSANKDTTQDTSTSSAAAPTYNTVYNPNGTVTYTYGNGTYTQSVYNNTYGSGYVSSNGNINIGSTTIGAQISWNTPVYQASIDYAGGKVTAKTFELNGADVGGLLDKICERLAIIESADPSQLEKYKALDEAYKRYKFLENLLVDKGDKPL